MDHDLHVMPVDAGDPEVLALLEDLTEELAAMGYTAEETFGYTPERLAASAVELVGARRGGRLVGVGGVEPDGEGGAELKRFYVEPSSRGAGVADAVLDALLDVARASGADVLRLETGDKQAAAIAFYRRRGFEVVPRFGPYVDSATSVCMARRLG
ncbi:GNAT family N-acetyltransferase [Pseudokineococcus sp. 1T1Z-3]|uniref:GNAT family N-acetyltransferase n=1 Tax=Pseudokineococcus sp. 1T1Z-3 TaxID=3132745 RepID=UPI0030A0F1EE